MGLINADELKENIEIAYKRGDIMQRLPIIAIIDNAPTVDKGYQEGHIDGVLQGEKLYARPQGEWIYDSDHSITIDMYKCSICDCFGHKHFNFCPNCGADMKGGGKNE